MDEKLNEKILNVKYQLLQNADRELQKLINYMKVLQEEIESINKKEKK